LVLMQDMKDQAAGLRPFRLAYQPPGSSTFVSQQTSHQQTGSSTFLSEQISTSNQPSAKRTGCWTQWWSPARAH
jgi:hypothetical protein